MIEPKKKKKQRISFEDCVLTQLFTDRFKQKRKIFAMKNAFTAMDVKILALFYWVLS